MTWCGLKLTLVGEVFYSVNIHRMFLMCKWYKWSSTTVHHSASRDISCPVCSFRSQAKSHWGGHCASGHELEEQGSGNYWLEQDDIPGTHPKIGEVAKCVMNSFPPGEFWCTLHFFPTDSVNNVLFSCFPFFVKAWWFRWITMTMGHGRKLVWHAFAPKPCRHLISSLEIEVHPKKQGLNIGFKRE